MMFDSKNQKNDRILILYEIENDFSIPNKEEDAVDEDPMHQCIQEVKQTDISLKCFKLMD